ncbi:Glutamate receptor ionotropic, kainate 5, partial [Larimichthys crocea]
MPALPALLLSIYVVVLLLTMAPLSFSQANTLSAVRMAAILDDQSVCGHGERLALALARENINSLMAETSQARVEVDVYELQKDSQYDTTDTMCQILPKGVVSVIWPRLQPRLRVHHQPHLWGERVQIFIVRQEENLFAASQQKHAYIPHVKIGPEETPKLPYLRFASVTLYPSNEDLSLAIGSILRSFGYPTASLVCAKAECLLRLEELVHRFLISRETLSVRMLDDSLDPTPLLKEIRDDKVATIIIDANASISYHILRKANELGMTSAFYKYILTTMDFPLLRLDDVVDNQSNIVGFSMLNGSHPFYLEFLRSLNLSWMEGCDISPSVRFRSDHMFLLLIRLLLQNGGDGSGQISLCRAVCSSEAITASHDEDNSNDNGVYLNHRRRQHHRGERPPGLHYFYLFTYGARRSHKYGCFDCDEFIIVLSSALMFDAIHVVVSAVRELNRSQEIGVEYDGLTGHIEFNSKGQRTNYTLKILEKHPGGHKEIGTWYSNNTLAMNSTSLDLNASETLANKTLIVTTILENPYVMRKSNYQDFQGNNQYEGFCVDMLRELADILKFSFKIKLVDDGLYGAPEPNGSWTGMVGELINR